MTGKLCWSAGILLLLSLCSSCTWVPARVKSWSFYPASDTRTAAPTAPEKPSIETLRIKIGQEMSRQNPLTALALIETAGQSGIREKDLAREYLLALHQTLTEAKEAFANGAFARSGKLYRAILDHFPKSRSVSQQLPFDQGSIQSSIALCAEQLMKRGLSEYRSGNLGQAISIWGQVLVFHPTHQPTRMALQTASTQLENLKALPTP